jgi:hypothetical protein
LLAVGALGYVPELKLPSRLLLALIIISLFLSQQGFWAKLQAALQSPPQALSGQQETQANLAQLPAGIPIEQVGAPASGGAGGALGQAEGALGALKTAASFIPFL